MLKTRSLRTHLAALLVVTVAAMFIGFYPLPWLLGLDFIQYWTAFKLARDGINPYEPATLLAAQQLLRPGTTEPIMMWNGPWIMLLFSPVLLLPFPSAVGVWAALNLVVLILAGTLITRLLPTGHKTSTGIALSALFFPVWACFAFGQISLLLLLGAVLLMFGALRGSTASLVGGAILASLKPHLFFFSGIVLLSVLLRRSRFKELLAITLAIGALLGASELCFPGLIGSWLTALRSPGAGAVAPPSFAVTTLVGVVRGILADEAGMMPVWPMAVMPIIPAVIFLLWRVRSRSDFNLATYWPGVVAVSYLFSPYGWVFDAVLLLPCYVAAVIALLKTSDSKMRRVIGFSLVLMQALSFALLWIPHLELHQGSFWWLPVLVFLGWLYSIKTMARQAAPER